MNTSDSEPAIPCYEALRIANADGTEAYRDSLSDYKIEIVLQPDGWHISYTLNKPRWSGGGPHYVIDATTGTIVSKKYYQ